MPATGYAHELAVRPVPLPLPRIRVRVLWHHRHDGDPAQRRLRGTLAQAAQRFVMR